MNFLTFGSFLFDQNGIPVPPGTDLRAQPGEEKDIFPYAGKKPEGVEIRSNYRGDKAWSAPPEATRLLFLILRVVDSKPEQFECWMKDHSALRSLVSDSGKISSGARSDAPEKQLGPPQCRGNQAAVQAFIRQNIEMLHLAQEEEGQNEA